MGRIYQANAKGGQDLPNTKGGQDLPGTKEGQDLPGTKEGQDLPVTKGGQDLPGTKGGQDLPGTKGGQVCLHLTSLLKRLGNGSQSEYHTLEHLRKYIKSFTLLSNLQYCNLKYLTF